MMTFMLLWALLVSYSRIYVGVHYPADIAAGAILGGSIGIFVYWLMRFLNQQFNFKLEL